jgi:soluble P-type ATPase
MLEIVIPGDTTLGLQHLVLDYNGTLARDGELLAGVKARLDDLSRHLDIHVLTADTFGKARTALADVPCDLTVLPAEDQATGKLRYVERLDPSKAVYIGNGCNDRLALEAAALAIAVIQTEGTSVATLVVSDVVMPSILDALDLLTHPLRLIATLRT